MRKDLGDLRSRMINFRDIHIHLSLDSVDREYCRNSRDLDRSF